MFPCTKCGLCCQNITNVKELKDFDIGNGICKYYNIANNECAIYDDRPDICRIEKMFKIKYYEYFTKKNYYEANAKICNLLQVTHNLNSDFRVYIKD
jgi:Fe-S-cluster containining protein